MKEAGGLIVREFEGSEIRFRADGETLWLSGEEIGDALGYEFPGENINKLFNAHSDEFDSDCTRITQNGFPGEIGYSRVREFSIEGLSLICMFSQQPKAKPFRKWSRKVLSEVMTKGSYSLGGLDGRHWTERLPAEAQLRLMELRMKVGEMIGETPDNPVLYWMLDEMCGGEAGIRPWLKMKLEQASAPQAPAGNQVAANGLEPFATRKCRPKIDGDPEVKELLSRLLIEDKMRQDDMLDLCKGRFGADRTPTKTSLHRLKRQLHYEMRLNW